jgi:hypothetical protein
VTISERTITASSVGGASEQSTFDGVAHGALTWAIKVVTDPWRLRRTAAGTELTLSYATLVSRVNALLGVLEFDVGPLPVTARAETRCSVDRARAALRSAPPRGSR